MDWRCRAGQVVDLIDFHIEREGDVMSHELKVGILLKLMKEISGSTCEEIVHAQDVVLFVRKKPVAKIGSEETGTAGNKDSLSNHWFSQS